MSKNYTAVEAIKVALEIIENDENNEDEVCEAVFMLEHASGLLVKALNEWKSMQNNSVRK